MIIISLEGIELNSIYDDRKEREKELEYVRMSWNQISFVKNEKVSLFFVLFVDSFSSSMFSSLLSCDQTGDWRVELVARKKDEW